MINITTLPKDTARCFSEKCNKKHQCLRYLDRYNGLYWNEFKYKDCEVIIKPKTKNNDIQKTTKRQSFKVRK